MFPSQLYLDSLMHVQNTPSNAPPLTPSNYLWKERKGSFLPHPQKQKPSLLAVSEGLDLLPPCCLLMSIIHVTRKALKWIKATLNYAIDSKCKSLKNK